MANKILNSGLFNEQAYLARYPDVAAGWKGTAEEHFLQYGANEGRIGNTNFDVTYLRSTYADLSGMTAAQLYTWYNQYGYAENRVTSSALASFNAKKYLEDNADLGKGGVTDNSALAHYLMFGVTEGRAAYNTSGVAYTVANGTVSTGTGGNEAGKETVLTTAQDTFTGTAGNDNFRAVAGANTGNQDQTTLNSSDIIDGAAGNDTLIVNLVGGNYGGGARIKNIETLQIGTNDPARTFDYNVNMGDNEVNGVNTVKYDQITTGETLNVINITPSATGTTIPTLHWANENGSTAGTAGATYRQASITGTADNQNIILENVTNGDLNIARGIETITVTSSGTVAANTLTSADAADGTAVDLVSETLAGNGVNDDSTLTKVIAKGEKALGVAATVNTNDVAGEAGYGLTNRAANGLDDLGNSAHAASASNLLSVAATVTEIDATEANGGINARFTGRVDGTAVNVTFKGGKAADYIEFARGNVNATGGEGADTFAFVNSNLTNFDFGSADSITGGAGSDTIQLGVNGNGTVVANTTEFNNKTGIDVLDLRGQSNTVTLADAFVAGADAGTFTVRTDKIVQTSGSSTANTTPSNATNNAGLENASVNTVVLTELADNRAIEFIGGSGSDRVVVDNASANQFAKLDGGTNAAAGSNDSLTVVNTSVLDANDVANIKGFELLNLVENTLGNSTFDVTLSEAFVLANSTATVPLTIASITGTYGQRLGAGDTVRLEVSDLIANNAVKASVAARTINVQDLVNAGVTVQYMVNGVATALNTIAAGNLAGRFDQATAPAATLLDDVAGAAAGGAGGGGAVAGATNVAVAVADVAVTGTAASENFNVAIRTTDVAINGAGATNSVTLNDGWFTHISSANASGNDLDITNIDTVILANAANTITVNDANARLANITGGTGVDIITITNMAGGGTIDLGADSDSLILNTTLVNATLNGGAGALDNLTLATGVNISTNTVSGFEQLTMANNGTNTMTLAQLNGFGNVVDGGGTEVVNLTTGGNLFVNAVYDVIEEFNATNATTGLVYTTATATGHVITGSNTAADNITAGNGVDNINTGGGNDTIVAGGGADSITGGAGADDITGGAATDLYFLGGTGDSTVGAMDIYRGVGNSETFNFAGVTAVGGGAITVARVADQTGSVTNGVTSATITNGVITGYVTGSGVAVGAAAATAFDTFEEVLAAVRVSVDAAGELAVFNFGTDEYIYVENSDADILIQLVGVNVTAVAVAAEIATVTI